MTKSKNITFTLLVLTILSLYLRTCEAQDLSLPPNEFSPTSYFHVYYEFSPPGSITFAIQFNKPHQYFSLGLGTSMTGSDIWVFNVVGGKVVALDYKGVGDTTPALDTAHGGKNNLVVIGQKVTSSGSFVKFTRLLNTGDKNDKVISPGPTSFIWATEPGASTLSFHGPNFGSLRVNLMTDSASVASQGAQGEEQLQGYFEEEAYLSEEGQVGENYENAEMAIVTEMQALEVGENLYLLL